MADLAPEKMTSGGPEVVAYLTFVGKAEAEATAAAASAVNAAAMASEPTNAVSEEVLGVVVIAGGEEVEEEPLALLPFPTVDVGFSPFITAETYSSTRPKNSNDFQSNMGSST